MAFWKQKRRTMKRYDSSAHVYDVQYSEEQQTKIETALSLVNLGKTSTIIDVGCGTGQLLPYVSNMSKLVVCAEISRNLVAQAKAQVKYDGQVAFLRADADYLPFRANKFDMVFAITLLQNMPKPTQTLNEMKRIAGKDAKLIITGLKKVFSEQQFTKMLKAAGFEVESIRMDSAHREFIAVCTNVEESLNRTRKSL